MSEIREDAKEAAERVVADWRESSLTTDAVDAVDVAFLTGLLSEVITAATEAAEAENKRLREALTLIAAFDDVSAQRHLERTGSFGLFDEPGSVEIARAALTLPDRIEAAE